MDNKHLVNYTNSPFSKVIAYDDYIKKVICLAQEKSGTNLNTPMAKNINVELRTWKNFISNNYIKILTFRRLSKFCGFSDEQIKSGIKNIDGIEKPNVPLNFRTKAGVRLDVGVINEGRTRSRSVEYTNEDQEVLQIIRNSARQVLGKNFIPSERIDSRDKTICLSFPPYFAKHFVKLGVTSNKNNLKIGIPQYIKDKKKFCKIWWQGNLSEEASVYAFSSFRNGNWYIVPRIQINRVKSVNYSYHFPNYERTYYHKDIPSEILSKLKENILPLIKDEAEILSKFGIRAKPFFSKLYINKKGQQTATYTILLSNLNDLRKYHKEIGFELDRHQRQFELLLFNRGPKTREEIRKIMIQFYELVPRYLRGNKKIKVSKWLTNEDKKQLLV